MSARPFLYQKKNIDDVIMSLASFLQKQKQYGHVAHRFLGLQHYYKTRSRIAVRKRISSFKPQMPLSCYQNTIVDRRCLRLLPPEYPGEIMDVSDAAQIKCARSHIPTPDVLSKKYRLIPPALPLLPNQHQTKVMSESAIVLSKRKQRPNMLLENSRAKRTM